jgi:hypothetical protein
MRRLETAVLAGAAGIAGMAAALSPQRASGQGAAEGRSLAAVCCFLLAVYLLTMAGRVISGDGETMYLTTRALVTQGTLAVEPRPESARGVDGRWYSKYGLGQTVAQLPLFVAGHAVGKLAGAVDDRPARFAVGMTNSFVTAALAGVFWLVLRAVGTGRGAATAATIVFGLTTLAWPYARSDFAEPLQALTLLGALLAFVRWRRGPALGWAVLGGGAAGLTFLTKAASAVLLIPIGLYFAAGLWQHYGRGRLRPLDRPALRRAATHVAAAGLPFALCVLFQAGLNYARFGSPAEFGYGDEPRTGFTTPLLTGIGYLLFSSGKGLLFFCPPVVVGLAGLVWLGRRFPLEGAVAGLVFLAELLYFGRWWAWHGDWCWGPRYLVVTVPFVMLGWGALFAGWTRTPALLKAAALLTAACGLGVSLLGVVVDYGAYYSVAGAQLGRGVDVRDARQVPAFSPILGHAWLARASLYELALDLADPGARASDDRPENPYTWDYPWRFAYPERRPEDPTRAFGFDLWFVALRDRTPFVQFWSALVAIWLALALLPLGYHTWRSATSGRPALTVTWWRRAAAPAPAPEGAPA